NSYKRLWGAAERTAGAGGEAPAYVCWGHNNRSALIRVPMYKPQKGNSTRVEFRSVDAACNPYLAFAVILAAGLKGIEGDYELPPGAEDDVWALTSAERRALGIRPLPQDLDQAIRVMQDSELVAETSVRTRSPPFPRVDACLGSALCGQGAVGERVVPVGGGEG